MRGVAPGLPDPEAFELEWSSSSSEESPAYATKPVFILFTAGSEKGRKGKQTKKAKRSTFGKRGRERQEKYKKTTATCFRLSRQVQVNYVQTHFGRNKELIDLNSGSCQQGTGWQPSECSHWLVGSDRIGPSNQAAGQSHRMSRAPPPIEIQHHPRDTWKRRKTQRKRENTKTGEILVSKEVKQTGHSRLMMTSVRDGKVE